MTSKNKYIKTLDKFLDIMKSKSKPSFYENEKDQIAEDLITACKKADLYDELTQEPTLSECIKEWEEREFEVRENTDHHLLFRHHKEDNVVEIFKRDLSYMFYQWFDDGTQLSIPFDLHNLIHKTLKALENNNETK